MGLVDYSDSESDSETVTKPTPTPAPTAPVPSSTAGGKKPFQKVVDRARPGKILVNLPQSSARNESNDADEPPAKRARIAARGGGGGAFSGFNSLLPPPKNASKPAAMAAANSSSSSSAVKNAPKPGVSLRTGAAPGFSREANDDSDADLANNDKGGGTMNLPAPKAQQQPSIPAEQKAAEDVKLVGKPLMFKPLSVSRKPAKKNTAARSSTPTSAAPPKASDTSQAHKPAAAAGRQAEEGEDTPALAPPKKVSLFSISTDPDPEPARPSHDSVYEPLFAAPDHHIPSSASASAFAAYDAANSSSSLSSASSAPNANTLDQIATEMNLSASARRELFGRAAAPSSSSASAVPDAKVISFDTTREYEHNEALRASGEQDQLGHNPVRAIAPGKHSLRQLVNQVHNQRDALEESFAKGRSTQREAGARYGWR
ncbi:mitotic checkpoint regulator, MAD2B-interacting-domain-containing protein [Biscogniauxia mediterranea]|nr:mitotic checkpoint regulator, MAD2B-interacting-domain-containing protein [Biscogniauxia mediterranea]